MNKTINKKGVSIMIGYVLLVSAAIVLGAIVYAWMNSYAPQNEEADCPDGVSVMISDIRCEDSFCTGDSEDNCEAYADFSSCAGAGASCSWNGIDGTYRVYARIKNNGRFNILGYYIRGTTSADAEIATLNLATEGLSEDGEGVLLGDSVIFGISDGENHYEPADEKESYFIISKKIYSVEILPSRFQEQGNKLRFINCGNSITKEKVECA